MRPYSSAPTWPVIKACEAGAAIAHSALIGKPNTNTQPRSAREARRTIGHDRLHPWRIAACSADQLTTALRLAEAWVTSTPPCAPTAATRVASSGGPVQRLSSRSPPCPVAPRVSGHRVI